MAALVVGAIVAGPQLDKLVLLLQGLLCEVLDVTAEALGSFNIESLLVHKVCVAHMSQSL